MDKERGQAFSQRCSRKKRNTPRARTKSLRRMTTQTYPCRPICQPACVLTPHKTPNHLCLRPPSLICLTRATPRALMQLAAAGYRGLLLGHFGCHRLDELLPKPRIGNREVHAGCSHRGQTCKGHALPIVLADKVEQSAHLPRGFWRPPACLSRAGVARASVVAGARWNL